MQKLKQKKGMKTRLTGTPGREIKEMPRPQTVAIAPERIPHLNPRVLVKEGERVKIGTPLVEDKRNTRIKYLSPGGGVVEKILFGPRRAIREIVIRLDVREEFEEFEAIRPGDLARTSREKIAERLMEGGMWQALRALPFGDTAELSQVPPMIIVSLAEKEIFSPRAGVYMEGRMDAFRFGIQVLEKLSPKVFVAAPRNELGNLKGIEDLVTHTTEGMFPSGDPGVILYSIKKTAEENGSWQIWGQDLIAIAEFLATGRYPTRKVVTSGGCSHPSPGHFRARAGAPVSLLAGGAAKESRVLTGGVLSGHPVTWESHFGYFEESALFMPADPREEFLGFIRPGLSKPSQSTAFLSALSKEPVSSDCTMHGEVRACVNCGKCSRICPVDLLPQFIMKANHADEIEEALSLGLLDCVGCGLCSYVCPSKIELSQIFKNATHTYYKDRE